MPSLVVFCSVFAVHSFITHIECHLPINHQVKRRPKTRTFCCPRQPTGGQKFNVPNHQLLIMVDTLLKPSDTMYLEILIFFFVVFVFYAFIFLLDFIVKQFTELHKDEHNEVIPLVSFLVPSKKTFRSNIV